MSKLPRTLEPEVMDSVDEARHYDSMDHREVNRRFVDDLLAAVPELLRGGATVRLLDLGTGTAQIPIELCQRVPHAHVLAVDAAQHMLELARRNVHGAGLADRISLERVDAKQLPHGDASVDGVISNSIVHHLPLPRLALVEAIRVTRPGGWLFFRDLLRPADEDELRRLVEQYAPGAGISPQADHQRAMFADSLHAALTLSEVQSMVASLGFDREQVRQSSDRHWTWLARGVSRDREEIG